MTPLVYHCYITPLTTSPLLKPQRAAETEANLTAMFTKKIQEQSLRLVALEAEKSRLDSFIQVSVALIHTVRVTRPIKTPCQHTLSMHPVNMNTPYHHTHLITTE